MADGLGFNGKKQLEQTKWKITVAPGSKTVSKGLRDGADGLDEQETQQDRSLVRTALYVGQDRPETQYATKEAENSCLVQRVPRSVCALTFVQVSWSFPYHEMPSENRTVTDANRARELEGLRSTSAGDVFIDAADCGDVNCRE